MDTSIQSDAAHIREALQLKAVQDISDISDISRILCYLNNSERKIDSRDWKA